VQGEAAPAEVAAGVRYFNRTRMVDVIVIARGGGSIEDLAAFNDEGLARVIAASNIPVISAVGHETDFTICDFVADLRAPTPSAAAELVIESKHRLSEHLAQLQQRLGRATRYQLSLARNQLTELAQHGAFARIEDLLGRRAQRLDELAFRLASSFRGGLRDYQRRLEIAAARVRHFDFRRSLAAARVQLGSETDALVRAMEMRTAGYRAQINQTSGRLEALSPVRILDRGYALVFDSEGKLVKDAAQLSPGQEINARLAQGRLTAQIIKTIPGN
jgi:exodeoxyribonuclease VII large subunit